MSLLGRCLTLGFAFVFAVIGASLAGAQPAAANVVIVIDKSAQRMSVVVDGERRHSWPISSGLGGGPPSGSYRPERMERKWYSRKYGWSPMPHSIFFHKGYAIHGTVYVSRLGRRASYGCVRLHPSNAATLFALVRSQGMARTRIVVSSSHYAARQ
jgi:lipoprotein-anchoring transpeptidase ErfK/SrfK